MEKRQRIVIIDDNANDLAVTRRFLERRGFRALPVCKIAAAGLGFWLRIRTFLTGLVLLHFNDDVARVVILAIRIEPDGLSRT